MPGWSQAQAGKLFKTHKSAGSATRGTNARNQVNNFRLKASSRTKRQKGIPGGMSLHVLLFSSKMALGICKPHVLRT